MHEKAKKIKTGRLNEQLWSYRGGFVEKHPSIAGRRKGNWRWCVCGAGGWVDNKVQALEKIDRLLAEAKKILDAENSQVVA